MAAMDTNTNSLWPIGLVSLTTSDWHVNYDYKMRSACADWFSMKLT
jgi:hypothetical protein